MIGLSEVQRLGSIVKPHGVCGEMVVTVPASLNWTDNPDCLVCSIDGILVPFWLESIREKSATSLLVKFEGYDSVESIGRFLGVAVYIPREFVSVDESESPLWCSFIDWKVIDEEAGLLGIIVAVDESTPNILFQVKDGNRERIIPANEVWITGVDRDNCILTYKLPGGLAEL